MDPHGSEWPSSLLIVREAAKALVVGIECDQQRMLNPDGTVTFQRGDVLWVVGDGKLLRVFMGGGKAQFGVIVADPVRLWIAHLCDMRWIPLSFIALFVNNGGHDLSRPVARFDLPAQLMEVSGLTDVDARTVACLQDEEATLYLVDLEDGHVRERHVFGPAGDLEGLTRVGSIYFALRSDGLVYRVQCTGSRYSATDSFQLRLPNRNIEGLCYDERFGHVLVAPKDNPKGSATVRDRRDVFAFDAITGVLLPEPVLSYSVSEVLGQARAKGVKIPMRRTPKGREVPMVKFRMASIAVDPVTDHYYVLSAVDHSLLVLDRQGHYAGLHLLDVGLLPKPEGITFLANGDMIITSEGKGTPPRLVRYARAAR